MAARSATSESAIVRSGTGDQAALDRIRAVSDTPTLADAELAHAREYGFDDWSRHRPAAGRGNPDRATDDYGRQPLRTAAEHGRQASVDHLLERGADAAVLEHINEAD